MKKPYAVKVNGVWYRPSTEIPEVVETPVETVETPVETEEKAVETEAEEEKTASKKRTKKD